MNRNSSADALVLCVKPGGGENNRLALLLSPQKGIFTAVVYGARKGKLRSVVSPYHSGTVWLYSDKVKQSVKITDFAPIRYRQDIRNSLYKTYAASLCSELILKTQGSVDACAVWHLANGFLDGLNICSEKEAQKGTLRFLWRYIGLMGLQSDCTQCTRCASEHPAYYSASENGFLCEDCAAQYDSALTNQYNGGSDGYNTAGSAYAQAGLFSIGAQGLAYLQALCEQSPKQVRSLVLEDESMRRLHDFLYYLIENCAGTKLKTLAAGKGIL